MATVKWFEECKKEDFEEGPPITATRYFRAEVDRLFGAITALRLHRPDLQRWQPHPDAPCWVTSPRYELVEGTRMYEITIPYSAEFPQDPTELPAQVEFHTWHSREVKIRDSDGRPIATTAGELIQGVEEDTDFWGLSIVKNVPSIPEWLLSYRGASNEDGVMIKGVFFPEKTLRIADIRMSEQVEDGLDEDFTYWRLQFDLLHRDDTWARYFPNAGYYARETVLIPRSRMNTATGRTKILKPKREVRYGRITDDKGEPIQQPEFLNENGERITDWIRDEQGQITRDENGKPIGRVRKWPLDEDDLIFLEVWTRKRLPFAILPLA